MGKGKGEPFYWQSVPESQSLPEKQKRQAKKSASLYLRGKSDARRFYKEAGLLRGAKTRKVILPVHVTKILA